MLYGVPPMRIDIDHPLDVEERIDGLLPLRTRFQGQIGMPGVGICTASQDGTAQIQQLQYLAHVATFVDKEA